jgi:hypothetical protein
MHCEDGVDLAVDAVVVEGPEAKAVRGTPAKPGEQGDRSAQGLGRVRSVEMSPALFKRLLHVIVHPFPPPPQPAGNPIFIHENGERPLIVDRWQRVSPDDGQVQLAADVVHQAGRMPSGCYQTFDNKYFTFSLFCAHAVSVSIALS